jgi:AcrR family transcriptional regulator
MTQQTMSAKEKRMMEAARLRHMENMSVSEISKYIGVAEGTVRNYFASEEMEQFKRFYSDQELFKLQQSLEQDVQDGNKLANNLLARAIQHDEAKPSTLVRAAKEAQKIRQRKVDMLQELGILEKPTEKRKVESEADTDELRQELVEGLKEKREELIKDE